MCLFNTHAPGKKTSAMLRAVAVLPGVLMVASVLVIMSRPVSSKPIVAGKIGPIGEQPKIIELLTTIAVTNENDSGEGSLRQAIIEANAKPGMTIKFPTDKVLVIQPKSPLPPITADKTVLAGTYGTVANEGAIENGGPTEYTGPLIWIEGYAAGKGADGIVMQANNCTVRGLVIRGFDHNQIAVDSGTGNKVQGCYIGSSPYTGASAGVSFGGFGFGDVFSPNPGGDKSGDSSKQGSLSSNTAKSGIASILNNRLKTAAAVPDFGAAIYVDSSARKTVIGGMEEGAPNDIYDENWAGVQASGQTGTGATIRRNTIRSGEAGIKLIRNQQSTPTITAVQPGASVGVSGTLRSIAKTKFAIDIYSKGVFVGTTDVTTDTAGNATFQLTAGVPNLPNQSLTATATNLVTGDTSQFSDARPVGGAIIGGQVVMNQGGFVPSGGPAGFPNVPITLSKDGVIITRTWTDYGGTNNLNQKRGAGYYQFCHLAPGSYVISASRNDLSIIPDTRNVTLGTTDQTKVDFIGIQR